jgi:hypothetical protein
MNEPRRVFPEDLTIVKICESVYRKVVPIFSAGVLLQAGGCSFDTETTFQTLSEFVLTRLVGDLVFGAFNLTGAF